MEEQGIDAVSSSPTQPARQEGRPARPFNLIEFIGIFLAGAVAAPIMALVSFLMGAPIAGWLMVAAALLVVFVMVPAILVLDFSRDKLIWRPIMSGFESEEDKQRRHELAMQKMKNEGTVEPHRIRGKTEEYKANTDVELGKYRADRDVEIEQLKADGRLAEMKAKILATPPELRSQQMKDTMLALMEIDSLEASASSLLPRDEKGGIRYTTRAGKRVIDFEDPRIETMYLDREKMITELRKKALK